MTETFHYGRWSSSVLSVSSDIVGLMCWSCESYKGFGNDPPRQESEALKLPSWLLCNQPPQELLEMQSCGWRRKEESNCLQLCISLCSPFFPLMPQIHLPHHHHLSQRLLAACSSPPDPQYPHMLKSWLRWHLQSHGLIDWDHQIVS